MVPPGEPDGNYGMLLSISNHLQILQNCDSNNICEHSYRPPANIQIFPDFISKLAYVTMLDTNDREALPGFLISEEMFLPPFSPSGHLGGSNAVQISKVVKT